LQDTRTRLTLALQGLALLQDRSRGHWPAGAGSDQGRTPPRRAPGQA
jgi:hypothetical protein